MSYNKIGSRRIKNRFKRFSNFRIKYIRINYFLRHNIDNLINNMPVYAFTQTLKPRFFKLKAFSQYMKTIGIIRIILRKYVNTFVIVPELTDKCNIHYHGTITIDEDESKYLCLIDDLRELGFNQFKPLTDPIGWKDYYMKDIVKTLKVLKVSQKYLKDEWSLKPTELSTAIHKLLKDPEQEQMDALHEYTIARHKVSKALDYGVSDCCDKVNCNCFE